MEPTALCCTTSVAVGQRAFNNYNGIGISLAFSPQAPSAAQLARGPAPPPSHVLQPPPMLAVVLDTSMAEGLTQSATQALSQALAQLNPQTRLLLVVVDQVVSMVDLKTPRPQSWVVHNLSGQGPSVLPQLVQAADIRATPLAHCLPYLQSSLAGLRHYPRQQGLQHHLRIMAAAADIALFLLTASMAAWDSQHKQQQQQPPPQQASTAQQQPRRQSQEQLLQQPLHNARVMVLTGLPNSSSVSAAHAAEQLRQLDESSAQQIRAMYHALANKAAALDIPLDVITGSCAAPAALLLQEAVDATQGRLLHQPLLAPPLAANLVAIAQSRFGWEGVLDIKLPAGVKLLSLSGPLAKGQPLPPAAYSSGSTQMPVTLLSSSPGAAAAAASGGSTSATAGTPGAASPAAAAAVSGPDAAAAGSSAGPMHWSGNAVSVPVLSSSTRFVASLELARDWPAGSSFEVQVVCEWTAVDGRRVRQVAAQTVHITDRLGPFMEALDVPAVVLLTSQRLVAAAAGAVSGQGSSQGSSSGSGLRLAAEPPKRAIEEARLSVGMALAHVAQRLGHAHLSRRGLFGFGSQQVWQLPDELIPLALSFYQLQRGPLISSAAAAAAADDEWHSGSSGTSSSISVAAARELMAGSWRVLVQQFMQCSPSTALRMVAPWLYVYDAASSQFDVLPPLNLALEPDALAVLDCGSEVIIYVGKVLMALVEGLPTPLGAEDPTNNGTISGQQGSPAAAVPPPPPPPQQQQQQAAAAAANGTPAAAGADGRLPALVQVPDMAEAAAPAVRCAQALTRGRVPVPAIRVVEDTAGMVALVRRLVPLHEDPMALQLLLLPHLNDISPMEHGYLLDWHRHWAGVAAATQGGRGQQQAARAGGARLASGEAQELSFGSWYSSFGVVLKSPKGAIAREGDANVEVE